MWPLQLKDQPKRRYSNEIQNNWGNQHIHRGVPSGTPDSYSGAIVIYIPSFSKKTPVLFDLHADNQKSNFLRYVIPTDLQFKYI